MCEITGKNFEKEYPVIINDLQSANFISYDCEFSGLFDDDNKCSLFDTPKERFNKLQNSLKNFTIIQFGLSTFKYERSSNTFSVSTYSFYIKPASIFGNQKFTYQLGSIEFLCKHNFNFNKLFYDGVDYLNKKSEADVLKMIDNGSLITKDIEGDIQKYCSIVAEWSGSISEGCETLLEIDNNSQIFVNLLHGEIRKRFSNIWTYFGDDGSIRIQKVNKTNKKLLMSKNNESESLRNKLFNSYLGFSRIIKEIERLKKPLIGHNVLNDLIMIYKQFYNPSPVSYERFKKDISDMFPNIYDTKSISFKLREFLTKENIWNSNTLSELYHYFKDGKGSTLVIYTPLIKHRDVNYIKKEQFHDAGFDSYCTGYCFIKMAHAFSLFDEEKREFKLTSMRTSILWMLKSVDKMKNQVNVMRGQVNHITLDGEDPKSVRPGLLYIQSKNIPIEVSKISEEIAKYGSVDIQLLSKYRGLMAVANRKQEREIMECFKNHKEFKVTKYNFMKDSPLGRTIISMVCIGSILLIKICFKRLVS